MWKGFINFVLGLWLVLSGIIVSLQSSLNLTIVGILAAIFGFWASDNWKGWVLGILGVWIFLSGIVFGLVFSWDFIISGIVLGILGLWSALAQKHKMKPPGNTKNWNVQED